MKFISGPLKSFIKLETASSIILFLVSIFAIIWANSSFGYLYEEIWYKKFTIGFINSGENNVPTDFNNEFVDLSGLLPFAPKSVRELVVDFIRN